MGLECAAATDIRIEHENRIRNPADDRRTSRNDAKSTRHGKRMEQGGRSQDDDSCTGKRPARPKGSRRLRLHGSKSVLSVSDNGVSMETYEAIHHIREKLKAAAEMRITISSIIGLSERITTDEQKAKIFDEIIFQLKMSRDRFDDIK